ncbi:MAG TPA: matrixin family metalloprotease [Polyangiaceae bacterium]
MNPNVRLLALALFAGALFSEATAEANCRTKACDTTPSYGDVWDEQPQPTECMRNAQGCYLDGTPLFWSSRCLNFAVQKDGSATSGIDAETARGVIQMAFDSWLAADCGGGDTPSFRVHDKGIVSCDHAEYNQDATNQNLFVFRDEVWPYQGAIDALALTTVSFNTETGEIYDADVELNSRDAYFTVTDEEGAISADLLSVVTHEAGHFLGLSHSSDSTAVMRNTGYSPGTTELRYLTPDDIAGVCEIFPPGQSLEGSCEPRHGFSSECGVKKDDEGCAVPYVGAKGRAGERPWLIGVAMGLVLALAFFRRRRT